MRYQPQVNSDIFEASFRQIWKEKVQTRLDEDLILKRIHKYDSFALSSSVTNYEGAVRDKYCVIDLLRLARALPVSLPLFSGCNL